MAKIFLCAGHDLTRDPGAVAYDGSSEASLTYALRDQIAYKLGDAWCTSGSVVRERDSHNLAQTIQYINAQAGADDFVLDLHFNHNARGASGTEVYYYAGTSALNKARAAALSQAVAETLELPDRGAKPDTATAVGSLGMLRYTPCPALLLEVCFLNENDLTRYRARQTQVAEAVTRFIQHYFSK